MAEGSDALQLGSRRVLQLAAACIALQALAVQCGQDAHVRQVGGVGPDGVGRGSIALGIPRIDDVDEVHVAVVVEVILREVHLQRVVGQLAGLTHHLSGMAVVALRVVAAIVRHRSAQRDGAHHVELRRELPPRLTDEVVARAARGSVGRATLLVHGVVEHLLRVLLIERVVGKLRQHHQPFHGADGGEAATQHPSGRAAAGTLSIELREVEGFIVRATEQSAVRLFQQMPAVGIDVGMDMLVAQQPTADDGAVGQLALLPAPPGRYGLHCRRRSQTGHCYQYLFQCFSCFLVCPSSVTTMYKPRRLSVVRCPLRV